MYDLVIKCKTIYNAFFKTCVLIAASKLNYKQYDPYSYFINPWVDVLALVNSCRVVNMIGG